MPEKKTIRRARQDAREGKAPTTQAGEFVKEEMEHIRKGKHGARSTKQAIAIALSKARKAGVKLPPPPAGSQSAKKMKRKTTRRYRPSAKRSQARLGALRKEPHRAASHRSISKQVSAAAKRRGPKARHMSAEKAVHTKGHKAMHAAAVKAAKTRARHAHAGA